MMSRPAGVPDSWPDHVKLMFDLQTLAVQADLTRVWTFMYAREATSINYPHLDISMGHHEISHHNFEKEKLDALAKINDHQPNVVFCDILMPRLDGYQTCALIKKNAKFQGTPVIMLSSKDGLFDRARGRMVGSDQYLTKPFTKDSLLKTVVTHVSRTAGPVAAAAR